MKIDFSQYQNETEIEQDIRNIKIQGATNVAIATFEGIKLYLRNYTEAKPYEVFLSEVEKTAVTLANARPNEPLAKNGVKFIFNMLRIRFPEVNTQEMAAAKLTELADEYLSFIRSSKDRIVETSREVLSAEVNEVLTHCHSSTAERILIEHYKRVSGFKVVCSETRPLFQGRITATNLVKAGLDTTLIADSAAESFIIGRGSHPIDMVFLGCDQITMQGATINKVGSWGVALAAYFASKPVYVVGSILKTDVSTAYKPVEIELREGKELWDSPPEGLKMVNPAFEIVNKEFITGYITEVGVLKPDEIDNAIQKEYQWLF